MRQKPKLRLTNDKKSLYVMFGSEHYAVGELVKHQGDLWFVQEITSPYRILIQRFEVVL